jgi:hypothetical protein
MVDGDVADDEPGEGGKVFIDSGNIFDRSLPYRVGVAGAGRVDKDQVGLIEQAVFIGHDRERRIVSGIRAVGDHTHRADRAHLQPDGG